MINQYKQRFCRWRLTICKKSWKMMIKSNWSKPLKIRSFPTLFSIKARRSWEKKSIIIELSLEHCILELRISFSEKLNIWTKRLKSANSLIKMRCRTQGASLIEWVHLKRTEARKRKAVEKHSINQLIINNQVQTIDLRTYKNKDLLQPMACLLNRITKIQVYHLQLKISIKMKNTWRDNLVLSVSQTSTKSN